MDYGHGCKKISRTKEIKQTIISDLHFHSFYSDGKFSPSELAERAFELGIKVVSLTDHDTVAGEEEMNAACQNLGIKNIDGIEISCALFDNEVHILGYNYNKELPSFKAFVNMLEKNRIERMEATINKLKEHNIVIDRQILSTFSKFEVSRSHIAETIAAMGIERDSKAAFDKWLGRGCPAYVNSFRVDAVSAVKMIKECGGVAGLAHPMRIAGSLFSRLKIIDCLKENGLDLVEANYKDSASETKKCYRDAAYSRGLLVSGGSDYHGFKGDLMPFLLEDSTAKLLGL